MVCEATATVPDTSSGALVFVPWRAELGLHNRRLHLLLGFVMARALNRTLVVERTFPPEESSSPLTHRPKRCAS